MDPLDREVLTLRHCEQLSNDEAAAVLGISGFRSQRSLHRRLEADQLVLASLRGLKKKS